MNEEVSQQRTGKATAELFEQIILRRLGARDDDVLVGPQHGVDVGVVRVAGGVAMALTADPVFVVPAYGWERAAWFAVHILASDAATSGLPAPLDVGRPEPAADDLGRGPVGAVGRLPCARARTSASRS